MPIFETLAITIGPSIAKNLLKLCLGEGAASDILGSLSDLLADKSKEVVERNEVARQMSKIGETIARCLEPVYAYEFSRFSPEDREIVVRAVAETLEQAQITTALLLSLDQDSSQLFRHLIQVNPDVTKLFSEDQAAVYERILELTSKTILDFADQFAGFDRLLAARILQDHTQIFAKLDKILAVPSEEAARYEQDYRSALQEHLDRFELFGIPRRDDLIRRQRLSAAYVVLNVIPTQLPPERLNKNLREGIGKEEGTEENVIPLLPADQILAYSRRIIIRGDAGCGKSTLLKWLAVQAASKHLSAIKNVVPFYIRLREFVDKDLPEDEDLPRLCFSSGSKPDRWVHQLLDSGRALVLIDGMDELPSGKRSIVLDKLKDLILAYPLACYIVASRPPALKSDQWPEWQEWVIANHFTDVTLQEMDETQVRTFIYNWYRALQVFGLTRNDVEDLENYPPNLLLLLGRRPPLRRLAANPLLCAMICALYHDRQQSLPSDRISLYEECVQMLLTRREEVRRIHLNEDYPDLDDKQKIGLIWSFAYWLMKNGYSDAEKSEVDGHFENLLPHFAITNTSGEKVRRYFVERANLLREPAVDRIDFMHRTLQEYLAACSAVQSDDIGLLIKNSSDDQWREVIILAAGVANTKQREKLITGLIKRADNKKGKSIRYLKLLALACLETHVDLSPDLRRLVLEKASEFIPPRDPEEAVMIAKAGDPAVPLLSVYPHQSKDEATSCQYALIQIGSESALTALEQYVEKPDLCSPEVLSNGLSFFHHTAYAKRILSKLPFCTIQQSLFFDGWNFLTHVRSLQISDPDFRNLKVLSNLTQLQELEISHTQVSDLTPLSSLTGLKVLSLSSTQVSDLTPLAKLTQLQELYIYNTKVSDLTPLANLPYLQKLLIMHTQVSDLTPLANLPNLEYILMQYNQLLGMRGIERFQKDVLLVNINFSNLENYQPYEFGFTDNLGFRFIEDRVESINQLVKLTQLQDVYIYSTEANNLIPLSNLTKLQSLRISEAPQVSDLIPLSSLTKLKELSLFNTKVSDLTPLSNLTQLQELYIYNTQVSDLAPLSSLTQLKVLNISNTQVSDLTPLSNLTQLQELYIYNTQVSDLTPLTNLTQLQELDIYNTQVSDLTPLSNLSHLQKLNISNTQVSDLTPLSNLNCLKHLNIVGINLNLTPIDHIDGLQIHCHNVNGYEFMY